MIIHSQLPYTLRQADRFIQAGKTTQAVRLLETILKMLPMNPQANSRLGSLFLVAGKFVEAIRCFDTARQAEPKVLHHWLRLIGAYQQTGDMAGARQVAQEAVEFNLPEATLEHIARLACEPPGARQHGLLQMYQSGKETLTTEIAARLFVDDYPDHPLGWQILGALLHDSGRLEESLEIKKQTVKKFPDDANAHNNLACTLLALKRHSSALKSARAALKLNPALVQAEVHRQQALAGVKAEKQAA